MKPTAVTQDWTHSLTFMQQTVLVAAVRGPDGGAKYSPAKMLLRWYRRCILRSSMEGGVTIETPHERAGGSFMGPSMQRTQEANLPWQVEMDSVVSLYIRELDCIPHHYQLHFLHAVEILGYKHPDPHKRIWWHKVYIRLVHDMHLFPESEAQLDSRLGDDRSAWLERCDPAVTD